MSDPRWTVDEDGDLVFGDAVAEIVHEDDTPYVVKKAAYEALVECVRSHDTLPAALDVIRRLLGGWTIAVYLPNGSPERWFFLGGSPSEDRYEPMTKPERALLDLLTGEGQ